MQALWVAALMLSQAPAPADDLPNPPDARGEAADAALPGPQPVQLQVDLEAEVAYVTSAGDYAHERGETGAGMVSAWAASRNWRAGIATRVSYLGNDPFGGTHPLTADLMALAGYRFWFSRFALGPQLGGGVELFGSAHAVAGPVLEAALEAAYRLSDTWTARFRFGFAATPTLEVASYWRWSLGLEWSGPL